MDCILFKTHFLSPEVMDKFNLIYYTSGMDVFMCVDINKVSEGNLRQYSINKSEYMIFSASKYIKKGYPFIFQHNDDTDMADNQDFVICDFFETNPHYNNYWSFDNDIFINGNVEKFLSIFKNNSADLIAGDFYCDRKRKDILNKLEIGKNYWYTNHNTIRTELNFNYNANFFGPLYRVSNRVVKRLIHWYSKGIGHAHNEIRIPTLLEYENINNGMNYTFFDFKKDEQSEKFIDGDGFRWLDINTNHKMRNHTFTKNSWYHPVKIKT